MENSTPQRLSLCVPSWDLILAGNHLLMVMMILVGHTQTVLLRQSLPGKQKHAAHVWTPGSCHGMQLDLHYTCRQYSITLGTQTLLQLLFMRCNLMASAHERFSFCNGIHTIQQHTFWRYNAVVA